MASDPGPGGKEPSGPAAATPSGFIDRYQVLEKIGEGGMGSLYLAWDPAIDRLVAIKLLRTGFDTPAETRHRFALEARAAGRLRHPNIVTIFDVGERDGVPFIAMEFLAGETLHDLIRADVRLPLPRRIKLLEELCDGLAYAHRAGMVHRDVKPANLIVDSDGVLKILDFGIARLDEGGLTQAGVLVGTLNYMAPEQVTGGTIGPHSDIFAVGLVAYELLSGRQAFTGTIQDGLLNRIATVGIEPLPSVVPEIDPELAAIVERALEPEPSDRYPDLSQMRNELIGVRKRLESSAETVADIRSLGELEARFGRGAPTPASGLPSGPVPLPSDRALPPPVLADAERALNAGHYRKALSLAGRSAAADPGDPNAAQIVVRAQTALLQKGRALETVGLRLVTSGAQEAPRPSTGSPPPGTTASRWRTVGLSAGAAAVILAGSLVWWVSRTPVAEPDVPAPPAAGTIPPPVSPPPAPSVAGTPAGPPAGQEAKAEAEPPAPARGADRDTPAQARRETRRAETPPQRPETAPSGGRAAAPAPEAKPAAPEAPAIRVAGRDNVPVPRRIRYVEPVYPRAAVASRAEGSVGIELTIGREGRVADARVVASVPGLDEAALAAVRQWEFQPVMVDGAAVPVIYTVTVPFSAPPVPKPDPAPPAPRNDPPAKPPVVTPPAAADPAEAKPKVPEKPAVDPAAEEAAVRTLLRQYAAAWEARDADAVARLQRLTPAELARVRNTLEGAAEYRMTIDVQKVAVQPDARTATVNASVGRRFRGPVGSAQNLPPTATTFALEKREGRWVIVEIK